MSIFLGLGSNIGNREANMRLALRWLGRECTIVAVSSLYRSEAVVLEGTPAGPDYLNAACEITTDLDPQALLRFTQDIEHEIGRRPAARWAPRVIDIDILLYHDRTIAEPNLTIPHPHLGERNFVLIPLAELDPEAILPTLHRTIGDLAGDIDLTGLEHLEGPEWASTTKGTKDHEDEEEGDPTTDDDPPDQL